MEKTVTKEEVKEALKGKIPFKETTDEILNELFPPEFDPKVGEYYKLKSEFGDVVKVESLDDSGWFWSPDLFNPYMDDSYSKNYHNPHLVIERNATPEEIATAEWEEGKPYKVWIHEEWRLRVSSGEVGYFYLDGKFEGRDCKWNEYEKLRMSEEEVEKLEDDRVASDVGNNWEITDGAKVFKAINGHYFKVNEDGTEVTLHKKESC